MSFNVAMLEALQAEGLDLDACIRVLRAGEKKTDATNAARQARHRERRKDGKSNAVTVTPVTPPNERDNLTPHEASEAKASSPQPWALPVGVSLQIWTDFLSNRKRKRLGTTATAWKSFNDDLARVASQTGIPPPELIRQCTAKGWGAIYDPRERNDGQQRTDGMGRNKPGDGISSTARAALAVFGSSPETRQ